MANRDDQYDPYIPAGDASQGGHPQGGPADQRIADINANITLATQGMQQNMSKLAQRGENLNSLQDKTDNLAVSAQGFRKGANRVRKAFWWKDMKMRIILVIGVIILLLIIIIPSVMATR